MLGCNMFCYCLNNPVNMADESGCWAVRSYNVMMTDTGGTGRGGYYISRKSAALYEELLKKTPSYYKRMLPHNKQNVISIKVVKSTYEKTYVDAFAEGVENAFIDLITPGFLGKVFGFYDETYRSIDSNYMTRGKYDCYTVTVTSYVYSDPRHPYIWRDTPFSEESKRSVQTNVYIYYIGKVGEPIEGRWHYE